MAGVPGAVRAVDIHEVDMVQTGADSGEYGTLYVNLAVGGRDVVRVHRHFPVSLYEEWMAGDFGEALYLSEIEPVYPRTEEQDE
jgi:hypothetical protein